MLARASLVALTLTQAVPIIPMEDRLSTVVMREPGLFQARNAVGAWNATLKVVCTPPASTTVMLTMNDGRRDLYTFSADGAPTVDSAPPPGLAFADKKAVIESLMISLGSRALEGLSTDTLCKNGEPYKPAAMSILRFLVSRPRELES